MLFDEAFAGADFDCPGRLAVIENVADPESAGQDSTLQPRRKMVYISDIAGGKDRKPPPVPPTT